MEKNTGVYTQADNFFSANGNNVDPRTGLLFFYFNFYEISDCEVVGPKVNLALSYTPMQTHNAYGLGTGFSLSGISVYNRKDKILSLYSGEKYKTKDIYGLNQVTILQQKMKVVDFKKTDQNNYVLTTKSGEVTHFKSLPQDGQWLVPDYIESPLGYRLYFSWKIPVNDQPPRLLTVANHNKKVLFEIIYPQNTDGKVSINTFPGSEKNKSMIELSFINEYLMTIKNVTDTFHYELKYSPQTNVKINDKSPLESITFPTGLKESVQYTPDVMKLPARQGILSYPAVTVHKLSPGQNQPDIITGYEYSDKNYLGNLADKLDINSPGDALYNVVSDYTYHSVEKLFDEKNETVKKVTREYNKYHLQTSEVTTYFPERCSVISENKYAIKANRPFDEQPINFLLPVKQIRRWKSGWGENAPEREEITEFTYDDSGNLQTQKAPDGTITVNDYYSASGEDGCPKDPAGFTRFIKSTTVTPPAVYGDEPTQRTEYRYRRMDTLPGSHVAYSVLQDTVTHKINDQSKFTEAFLYHDAAGVNFGRVKTKTQTQRDKDGNKYISRQHLSVSVQGERLVQTEDSEILDEDGVSPLFSVASRSELCRATGKMLSETDAAGNRVDYDYDNLGRLLKKTHHPDKPEYTSTETYDYLLPDGKAGTPAQTIHTDIRGNKTRIDYDGLGRKLAQWMTDRDSEGQQGEAEWSQVAGLEYDSAGMICRLTKSDMLHTSKATRQFAEGWKNRTYDKWGQPYAEKGHDGVVSYSETDPVALTTTCWTASETGTKVTGKQVTHYNQNHQPVKTELFTAEGKSYAVNLQDRDGVQRLRKATDALGRVTTFTYDDEGRVTETRLPDDVVVKKSYVPFTSEALITRISLIEKGGKELLLGTQLFDRLGRLKETTSGGRTTTMTYDSVWQSQPSTVTGPDKVVQTFTRDPALGEAVTVLNAGSGGNAISQSFDYERPTATLKKAKESDTATSWKTYPSGRAKSEISTVKGGQENAQHFTYSLAGAVEQDTDISNITRQHHYSISGRSAGQLIKVSDQDITLTPAYDELQRMTGWRVTDKAGHILTTVLTLDDFGREEDRTVTHSNGESFILTQVWNPNNQLKSRTRFRGSKVLLKEEYFYDARNRLEKYQAGPVGGELAKDPYGNFFNEQRFTFDALGNIRTCTTVLQDGSQNVATFYFDNPADPCQLTSVTNSLKGKNYPAEIRLEYDDAGRMTKDEAGRILRYDALGRLQQVISEKGSGRYGYDASNRLCWQIVDKTRQLHRLYYRGNKLANEWLTPEGQPQDAVKDSRVRLAYAGSSNIAQINQEGSKSTTSLIGTDAKSSVVTAQAEGGNQQYQYTPYGYRSDVSTDDSVDNVSEEYRDE